MAFDPRVMAWEVPEICEWEITVTPCVGSASGLCNGNWWHIECPAGVVSATCDTIYPPDELLFRITGYTCAEFLELVEK